MGRSVVSSTWRRAERCIRLLFLMPKSTMTSARALRGVRAKSPQLQKHFVGEARSAYKTPEREEM